MTAGWVFTLYLLGFVASAHLVRHGDKDDVWTMAAVFLLSVAVFGALYFGIRRWNAESIRLNALHDRLEALVEDRTGDLETQNRKLQEVIQELSGQVASEHAALNEKIEEATRVTRLLVARELRMHDLKLELATLQVRSDA